jgi:hypothetical protein
LPLRWPSINDGIGVWSRCGGRRFGLGWLVQWLAGLLDKAALHMWLIRHSTHQWPDHQHAFPVRVNAPTHICISFPIRRRLVNTYKLRWVPNDRKTTITDRVTFATSRLHARPLLFACLDADLLNLQPLITFLKFHRGRRRKCCK